MKIYNFDSIPSTNDFAKSVISLKEDCIITAAEQTNGHGSKGRSFCSPRGGLYITALRFYNDLKASNAFKIMVNSSVAVCRTMEEFALSPQIKWPNDVYVCGKKICGILIENTFSGEYISRSIVGIGVNIENVLPIELNDIAINMSSAGAKGYSYEAVRQKLVENLFKDFTVEEYKKYIFFLGKQITLIEGDKKEQVTAVDIDLSGRLIVKDKQGITRFVSAAEVSLRI